MSRKKIKIDPKKISAEALMKAVAQIKEINDKLIDTVEDKLRDFHNKCNNLNARLMTIEKHLGIEIEGEGDVDDVGRSEEESDRGGAEQ